MTTHSDAGKQGILWLGGIAICAFLLFSYVIDKILSLVNLDALLPLLTGRVMVLLVLSYVLFGGASFIIGGLVFSLFRPKQTHE